jgi:hypothetical protein
LTSRFRGILSKIGKKKEKAARKIIPGGLIFVPADVSADIDLV